MAALDDLGVARDDLDACRAGGKRDRLDLLAQHAGVEPLLEDHRDCDRQRARARDGEVVDGAVNGQLADRAAREAQRLDHEAVGGDEHVAGGARVIELGHAERGREQAFDQRLGRLAAGAVRDRDRGVLEARPLRARGLDDPEDPLLT
jgi:hypothetical protein